MMAQATNSTTTPPVTPTGPASNAALGEAVQHAVGGGAAAPAAADPVAPEAPHYAPGSVPQKPSQGAVTGALTRVLPAARSCLNPDDPLSRANVTFISGGTVSSVVITGGAAGKPAEECIRRALMKANVPPFAQDTYAANINVRPN
jgi:hypothetical protein